MAVTGAEVHGDLPRPVSYCKHGPAEKTRLIRTGTIPSSPSRITWNLSILFRKTFRLFLPLGCIHTKSTRAKIIAASI